MALSVLSGKDPNSYVNLCVYIYIVMHSTYIHTMNELISGDNTPICAYNIPTSVEIIYVVGSG